MPTKGSWRRSRRRPLRGSRSPWASYGCCASRQPPASCRRSRTGWSSSTKSGCSEGGLALATHDPRHRELTDAELGGERVLGHATGGVALPNGSLPVLGEFPWSADGTVRRDRPADGLPRFAAHDLVDMQGADAVAVGKLAPLPAVRLLGSDRENVGLGEASVVMALTGPSVSASPVLPVDGVGLCGADIEVSRVAAERHVTRMAGESVARDRLSDDEFERVAVGAHGTLADPKPSIGHAALRLVGPACPQPAVVWPTHVDEAPEGFLGVPGGASSTGHGRRI